MIRKRALKTMLTMGVAALLAGAPAAAQQQDQPPSVDGTEPGTPSQQPGIPGHQSPTPTYQNTPGAAVPGGQESMARSFNDQVFVRDTLEHSSAEARMSLLAEQKSPSPDVKQFGQRMVFVHNQLEVQLKPIAQKLDVGEKQKLDKKHKQEIAQLETLSGPAFDQEYIRIMVRNQRHDLKKFKTEAGVAQDPEIQEAAKVDARASSRRLQTIEQIAQSHNVTVASK